MILGIDSAPAATGWALVAPDDKGREHRFDSGVLLNVTGSVIRDFVDRVSQTPGGIEVAVIEDVYLARTGNVDVVKTLSRLVGRWQQEFERVKIPTRLVMADVWQKGILSGLIEASSARARRKLASQIWVEATYRLALGEDESDALGIATWMVRLRKMGKRAGVPAERLRKLR